MAAVNVPLAPINVPAAAAPVFLPEASDPVRRPILSRKRRMNFFDLANLLDNDGNLQNEMLVFAFAATMLSTIPVLLGNEFDVNVGLRRRKRDAGYDDDPGESSYFSYTPADEQSPAHFSNYTYWKIMTAPKDKTDIFHIHNDSPTSYDTATHQESAVADATMNELLRDLLVWSKEKIKGKLLLPMLINLGLDRYHGNNNPADKLVRAAYKKWKNYWYW